MALEAVITPVHELTDMEIMPLAIALAHLRFGQI